MPLVQARAASPDGAHSVGYAMSAIAAAIVFAGLAGAYGLDWWLHRAAPMVPTVSSGGATVSRTLVGKTLTVPVDWLGEVPSPASGFSSRIAFRVGLPLGHGGAPVAVGVTLLPLSQVRPSAALLDGVYLHQFMPNEVAGPAGLVGKPLYGSEGFAGETVWYDALAQTPFVAKCSAPPGGDGDAQCLRTVALSGGIAAVYSFPGALLNQWRRFDLEMAKVLRRIGAA